MYLLLLTLHFLAKFDKIPLVFHTFFTKELSDSDYVESKCSLMGCELKNGYFRTSVAAKRVSTSNVTNKKHVVLHVLIFKLQIYWEMEKCLFGYLD